MAYTGMVTQGGAPDVRELDRLRITKLSVGPFDNNAYVLTCTATGDQLLIDAAAEADRLLPLVPRLVTVLTTHAHLDHWQALAEVASASSARTVAHLLDAPALPVVPDQLVAHGDRVAVGQIDLEVIHLRGHTPGSVALHWDGQLWSGDCLFPGGPGNTDKDQARFASLMDDLEERVFGPLPDQTWVYPGHGPDTTLGAERPQLAAWRERGW